MAEENVALSLPSFRAESSFTLREALKALGMVQAFDCAAGTSDFSGIVGPPDVLCISKVIHKAFVAVDEDGTEAAAATAVVMADAGVSAPPPPAKVMRVDRPFLFLIRDIPTGSLLFLGRIVSPAP
jgi:serpin B